MTHPSNPKWKIAGKGMTDDEMHFFAEVLKKGPKDPVISGLIRQWDDLWAEWAATGKAQEGMERGGVGATEVDNLFKARLAPKIARFQKTFSEVMGHLSALANK